MRNTLIALIVLASSAAYADEVAGNYDVKFDQVSTNCEHPLAYPAHAQVKIDIKNGDLQVDIDRTPLMVGKPVKTGKISAKSPKPGHTPIEGMDGVFSVAGRVSDSGMLSLVLVGEYQTAGKPLCTQSWNLSGIKGGKSDDKKQAPPKK